MKLEVDLKTHPYEIVIERGSFNHLGEWVKSLWKPQQIVIITDNRVAELYAESAKNQLIEAGFEVDVFRFLEGEQSKNLTTVSKVYDFLANRGMTRSDGIIALGGGVVGDLAGFVASTYMRGIHFLQVPTTLLAQVDSSVGGKTGVNTSKAKNLVGAFAQPDGVLIDPDVLNTLDDRRIREGIAEIVKSALIADADLWQELGKMTDEHDLLENHAEEVILAACNVKRKVVVEDEFDNGQRLILNFGHTIGHAIEATAGYGIVTHGEGVALGMSQMSKIAEEKGLMPDGITQEITDMLEKFHLPIDREKWDEEVLYQALTLDKKARGSKIKTIIVPEIGQASINVIELTEMKDYLKK
ncbi:3-dehydroquinate synthase [Floricoccus tropicus]|uniref:3-dehydroquinate synthase n=1 Tax=Floricoccus tropicus TaxID=1859473 RepID=A0A1E8GNW4_9LACT|nr:3-dehydroquinate synthase [Floricoccus tropicus]OFI49964.1 3-dehydroquinate synthase [Floricoccus tropicus]